jgi:uncharacterized protein YceK
MAALTRANRHFILVVGLVLLQGCGSCVEDPNAKGGAAAAPAQAGTTGPAGARFSKTSTVESARPPLYRVDGEAP